MKELWINLLQALGQAWWVEIVTDNPKCIYYFGPFASSSDAESAKIGFIEDLEHEGAQNIGVKIKRCKPNNLTIYDDRTDLSGRAKSSPAFSS